jgi:hypothetical protein
LASGQARKRSPFDRAKPLVYGKHTLKANFKPVFFSYGRVCACLANTT